MNSLARCPPPPCPPATCPPASGVQVILTTFTASGPYMPSPGLVTVVVECIGGGGGGGSCSGNTITQGGGGGGGSGGYSRIALAAVLVLGGVQVTIGAGGTPGGANGAATSFGALCVANGGVAGQNNNSVDVFGEPGAGAPAGVGGYVSAGAPGTAGTAFLGTPAGGSVAHGGNGGSGPFGGGGLAPIVGAGGSGAGYDGGTNTGAGGGGAVQNQANANFIGGYGGSGVCIVTEYCWADVVPGEDCSQPVGAARVARYSGGWDQGGFDGD